MNFDEKEGKILNHQEKTILKLSIFVSWVWDLEGCKKEQGK